MDVNETVEHSLVGAQHGAAMVSTKAAGFVAQVTEGVSGWTIALSILLAAIVYDQGMRAAKQRDMIVGADATPS